MVDLAKLVRLQAESAKVAPLIWEQLCPFSKKNPSGHRLFTNQRLQGAKNCVLGGKIIGLSVSRSSSHLQILAYIHSQTVASRWYLTTIQIPLDELWSSTKFSCPCLAGKHEMFCHHAIALLIITLLLQTLPAHRPKWFGQPGILPVKNSKNTTAKFKARWEHDPMYIKSPQKLLDYFTFDYSERPDLVQITTKQTFQFKVKAKKLLGVPRAKYKTQSWRVAKRQIGVLEVPETPATQAPTSSTQTGLTAQTPRPRFCRTCRLPMRGHTQCSAASSSSNLPAASSDEPPPPTPLPPPSIQIQVEFSSSIEIDTEPQTVQAKLFPSIERSSSFSNVLTSPQLRVSASRERREREQRDLLDPYQPRAQRQKKN